MNDTTPFSAFIPLRRSGWRALPVMLVLLTGLLVGGGLKAIYAAATPGVLQPGPAIYTSPTFPGIIQQFAWSPDSQRLAMVNPLGQITIQDATTGEHPVTFALPIASSSGIVIALTWSPDGTTLLAETEESIDQARQAYIINPVDGTLLRSIAIDAGVATDLAGSGGGTAFGAHFPLGDSRSAGQQRSSAWSPDGSVLAAAVNGSGSTVALLDPTDGKKIAVLDDPSAAPAGSVSWSADGNKLAVGNADGVIEVWDIQTEKVIFSHKGKIDQFAVFEPHGLKLAISEIFQGQVEVWDVATNQVVSVYPFPSFSLSWSPDGLFLVGGSGSTTDIWSTTTGTPQFSLIDKAGVTDAASWSPNGNYIVATSQLFDKSGSHIIVWPVN